MSQDTTLPSESVLHGSPVYTMPEILQQPLLWPTTLKIVRSASDSLKLPSKLQQARVLLTGAGTSAYAAVEVAVSWPRAIAVPTTDLLIDTEHYLADVNVVISLARSGDSPESAAVVR